MERVACLDLAGDLDDVELIMDMESAFGIRIQDDEAERVRTVGDLFDLIVGKLGPEGGPMLVNLAAAAQRLQQQTTSSKYGTVSTGPEGAMFSGSSLSTGKPTFWYAGM